MVFWLKKQRLSDVKEQEVIANKQIQRMRRRAHKKIADTDEKSKKLNGLLRADGITLKIYIAKGGYHDR